MEKDEEEKKGRWGLEGVQGPLTSLLLSGRNVDGE